MGARDPLTKQRSSWRPMKGMTIGGVKTDAFVRNVHDGRLRALVSHEPQGWHLSISHVKPNGEPGRYPTWDEIAHADEELLPSEVTMAMILPPADEYVAHHPTTFHLNEIEGEGITPAEAALLDTIDSEGAARGH